MTQAHPAETEWIAFAGDRRLATGSPEAAALAAHAALQADPHIRLLVLDAQTARKVEPDLRGSADQVRARLAAPPRGPGRPKLGVSAREVTLLPRHWDWLARQPGGASAALRRLVEQASREGSSKDRARAAQEAAYRFLTVTAGDREGYEEAARALFAGDPAAFAARLAGWPEDIREEAMRFAAPAFEA
jgi:hypothetical protein